MQTIQHPHNVGQPHVSPHPQPPSALHLPLPWEPDSHPWGPTTLLIAVAEHLLWALGRLAQLIAMQPPGGYALLTAAEPGTQLLMLPGPLQTYQLGPCGSSPDHACSTGLRRSCNETRPTRPVRVTCARHQGRAGQRHSKAPTAEQATTNNRRR